MNVIECMALLRCLKLYKVKTAEESISAQLAGSREYNKSFTNREPNKLIKIESTCNREHPLREELV